MLFRDDATVKVLGRDDFPLVDENGIDRTAQEGLPLDLKVGAEGEHSMV